LDGGDGNLLRITDATPTEAAPRMKMRMGSERFFLGLFSFPTSMA
jgi:hypothetical protein